MKRERVVEGRTQVRCRNKAVNLIRLIVPFSVILDDLIRSKDPPIFSLLYFIIDLDIRFDLYHYYSQEISFNLSKLFVVVLQTTNHGFNTQLHTLSLARLALALPSSRTPSPNLLILSPR
jgi:hypothetical protein